MPAAVNLEMSIADAKLVSGLLNAVRAQSKLTEGVGKTTAESKKLAFELDRTAQAAKKLIETPVERLTRKEQELTAAVKAGKLSVEEKSRAMAVYKQQIMGVERETKQLAGQLHGARASGLAAFGPEILASLGQYVSLTGGITAAVGLASKAWDDYRQRAQAALDRRERDGCTQQEFVTARDQPRALREAA